MKMSEEWKEDRKGFYVIGILFIAFFATFMAVAIKRGSLQMIILGIAGFCIVAVILTVSYWVEQGDIRDLEKAEAKEEEKKRRQLLSSDSGENH